MDYRIFIVRTDVNSCDCTRGCTDTVRESALEVDSGRKIPCRTGESNLRRGVPIRCSTNWSTSPPASGEAPHVHDDNDDEDDDDLHPLRNWLRCCVGRGQCPAGDHEQGDRSGDRGGPRWQAARPWSTSASPSRRRQHAVQQGQVQNVGRPRGGTRLLLFGRKKSVRLFFLFEHGRVTF